MLMCYLSLSQLTPFSDMAPPGPPPNLQGLEPFWDSQAQHWRLIHKHFELGWVLHAQALRSLSGVPLGNVFPAMIGPGGLDVQICQITRV